MIIRQKVLVTGSTNAIAYGDPLTSTQAEPKRLLSVGLVVSEMADNDIQGYWERTKVFDIPDRLLDVETDAFTYAYAKPGARLSEIPVGLDIPIGESFRLAIKCGASAKNLYATYNYELVA